MSPREQYANGLNKIIERHGKSLSFIFNKFGIKAKPTPETLVLAFVKHKDAFANALDSLNLDLSDNHTSGFDGEYFSPFSEAQQGPTLEPAVKKKKSFKELLNTGVELVTTGATVYNAVKGPKHMLKKSVDSSGNAHSSENTEKIMGMPKVLFFGLIAVVVLTVVFVIVKKK